MLLISKKKKQEIAFLLGCIWYYVIRADDEDCFSMIVEFLAGICVRMGIDWKVVEDSERAYETWKAFQDGCL